MCFITYKGLMVIFLAFNGDTSIGISLPIFLELWQLFFEKNNSFYQHINEIKAGIYLWIFTFLVALSVITLRIVLCAIQYSPINSNVGAQAGLA